MRSLTRLLASGMLAFSGSVSGSTAIIFGTSTPVLLGTVGLAVDYNNYTRARTNLQGVADDAALSAAHELKLSTSTPALVQQLAIDYVNGTMAGAPPAISATVPANKSSVTVKLTQKVKTVMPQALGLPFASISVQARAMVTNTAPLCLLTLDSTLAKDMTISLGSNINAASCAVYSNSNAPDSINVTDASMLNSAFACVRGGYTGNAANYTNTPMTGCPALKDPLASRLPPPIPAACDFTKLVIKQKTTTITPGRYCGGLTIQAGSNVTAMPGVYIIQNGGLTLLTNSTLTGAGVGFYLTGYNTTLNFEPTTTVDLSAPINGPMAGMLIWEERQSSLTTVHTISSQNAHNLLGTLYFPNGNLVIGSPNAVGDRSSYTIIVSRQLTLQNSPALYQNSNFATSIVPVPAGLGPTGGDVSLQF